MVWIGDPSTLDQPEIPLVLLEPPCRFRDAALGTLAKARRDYRIVLETPHLPAMRAGVRSGLGASCRTRRFAAAEGLSTLPAGLLTEVPEIETILIQRNGLPDAAHDLAELLVQAASDQ